MLTIELYEAVFVFSCKIFLSKLHYLPITSNFLPRVWSTKYR